MKEVTIIIPIFSPNYNYLKECLDSITNQTVESSKFNLIIGCDGKVNNKIRNLLDNYIKNNQFASYKTFERAGLKKTLNKLVDLCKTKYIARMDADDIMNRNRIEVQLNFFKKNPNIKLLGTALKLFPNKKFNIKLHPTNTFSILLFGAIYGNPFSHPTIMCETDVLKKYLYKEDSPYEDYDLWYKFAFEGELKNINTPLLEYRVHQNQISAKKLSYWKMLKIRIKYARAFILRFPYYFLLIAPLFILLFIPHRRTI